MAKTNYQGVIFDLDGTLIDTIEDIAAAINTTLSAYGFLPHSDDAYKHFIGRGWVETVQAAVPHGTPADTVRAVIDESRARYHKNWCVKTCVYDGIVPLLTHLEKEKIVMAVLTNKVQDLAVKTIRQLLPGAPFDLIYGRGDAFRPKPDPEGALIISRKTGIDSERFLFVGDSDVDMMTASAAGMVAVGACWGYRGAQELKAAGGRVLVSHPMEIAQL